MNKRFTNSIKLTQFKKTVRGSINNRQRALRSGSHWGFCGLKTIKEWYRRGAVLWVTPTGL